MLQTLYSLNNQDTDKIYDSDIHEDFMAGNCDEPNALPFCYQMGLIVQRFLKSVGQQRNLIVLT